MKNLKTKITLVLLILITLISTVSNASYTNVTMSVIQEPKCTINFGTKSYVERSVISKDLDKKEITLQLKAVNNEESLKPTGEIMLVIDNSTSMIESFVGDNTREKLVIESAKTLITNLLEDNTKLKIGAVSFSTNSDTTKMGTIEDAKLLSELTNDTQKLMSAISNIEYNGGQTNLDSGISLAKQYFTTETDKAHKYMIVLTDGVPNIAIDHKAPYYSEDVFTKTKTELQSLSNISDNVIIMLTGIENGDQLINGAPTEITYNQVVEKVFGTTEKPTIGKFYYITDDKIEETIKSNIYKDLLPISQSYTDLKITDYFPQEIVDNFEFSYVKNPNIGKISPMIDEATNSITWTIPELKSGETAIVQYKLKLKNNYDEKIVDKILDTNTKLDLTYTDFSGSTDTKTSDIKPQIKLTEPLPTVLPKAGKTILLSIIGLVLAITVILGIRYFIIKNKTK